MVIGPLLTTALGSTLSTDASSLSVHEALSGVFGSISLAAWIFLFVPQLIENYRRGSADGVSLSFIAIWFVGDVTNLLGAVGAGLVPTVIAMAVYFCAADLVLILQCLFYNHMNAKDHARPAMVSRGPNDVNDVERPLLSRNASDSLYAPSTRRRSSAAHFHRQSHGSDLGGRSTMANPPPAKGSRTKAAARNLASLVLVGLAGAAGWLLAWRLGAWTPTDEPSGDGSSVDLSLGPQILGYISAVCYLGARIPQIIKNHRDQSCDGLSLLFFILSLFGNITYGASILFHSVARDYVIVNLPWLIGSLGTMAEDVMIFAQFHMYSKQDGASTSAVI